MLGSTFMPIHDSCSQRVAASLAGELQLEIEDQEYDQALRVLEELICKIVLLRARKRYAPEVIDRIVFGLEQSAIEGDADEFARSKRTLERLVDGEYARHVTAYVLNMAA